MSDYFLKNFGVIPNNEQRKKARLMNMQADVDKLLEVAAPIWDSTDRPAVVSWQAYRPVLEAEAEQIKTIRKAGRLEQWWETARRIGLPAEKLFLETQGNKGSCAGCSMFERAYLVSVLKQISLGAEMEVERINPMVTYAQSLGCNREGERIPDGQTIAAVLNAGAEIGTYPARLVGEYDPYARYSQEWEKYSADAAQRQMGVCPLTNENGDSLPPGEMAAAIGLALRANKAVEFGNMNAVANFQADDGEELIGVVSGKWSHATIWSGYKISNGKEYFRWENTHGNIYKSKDGAPKFGCWFDWEGLQRMCSAAFCDAGIITYAEAPRGEPRKDLNPRE